MRRKNSSDAIEFIKAALARMPADMFGVRGAARVGTPNCDIAKQEGRQPAASECVADALYQSGIDLSVEEIEEIYESMSSLVGPENK